MDYKRLSINHTSLFHLFTEVTFNFVCLLLQFNRDRYLITYYLFEDPLHIELPTRWKGHQREVDIKSIQINTKDMIRKWCYMKFLAILQSSLFLDSS